MSHYRVAVFSNDPSETSFEELLAPYNEELKIEFVVLTDEEIVKERKRYINCDYPGSFEEYLTAYGYENDPVSGAIGYWHNPEARWDWYSLDGGEWQFDLKKGESYDEWGKARKNQYKYTKNNVPYAFITPDGVWHAPGRVGWFATSDDTPESMKVYVKEWMNYVHSPVNPYVNFVDCHI